MAFQLIPFIGAFVAFSLLRRKKGLTNVVVYPGVDVEKIDAKIGEVFAIRFFNTDGMKWQIQERGQNITTYPYAWEEIPSEQGVPQMITFKAIRPGTANLRLWKPHGNQMPIAWEIEVSVHE